MTEPLETGLPYAVVNAAGLVENLIMATPEFVTDLVEQVDDPDVDTGELSAGHRFYDTSGLDPQPQIGWTRARNGRWVAPAPPEPPELTEEQRALVDAAEQAAADRAADDEFIAAALAKVRGGGDLTEAEVHRLDLVRLARA